MDFAVGQFPYEPGVNGSEKQSAFLCLFPGAFHIIKYPFYFCGREIGIYKKSCGRLYIFGKLFVLFEFFAHIRRSSALPYYGVIDGDTRILIPDDGCFPLVGYAYGGYFGRFDFGLYKGIDGSAVLGIIYILGVMLNPAGLRIYLGIFLLTDTT